MIVQFYAPGVLLQCKECKLIEKCEDGIKNPDAAQCGNCEPTKSAIKARDALQMKLSNRESLIIES